MPIIYVVSVVFHPDFLFGLVIWPEPCFTFCAMLFGIRSYLLLVASLPGSGCGELFGGGFVNQLGTGIFGELKNKSSSSVGSSESNLSGLKSS